MKKETPYGEILMEIEDGLWDHDSRVGEGLTEPYSYTDNQFRACLKIFMSSLLWKLWDSKEGDVEAVADLAGKMGEDLRTLINAYTGIDTHSLY